MVEENFFTYKNYKRLLQFIKDNYPIHDFSSYKGGNGVIIRHDLDLGMEPAYRMMKIEKECGITSTFFVMISSPTYNALSDLNRKIIKKISDNGFEIGLHFDPQIYSSQEGRNIQEKIKNEANILESITGRSVKSVSMHNPSVFGEFLEVVGYKDAYQEPFFSDENYFSDSCMKFRGKDVYQVLKNAENNLVQILLHPLHFNENFQDYISIFTDFLSTEIMNLDYNFRVIDTYENLLAGESLIDLISFEKKD